MLTPFEMLAVALAAYRITRFFVWDSLIGFHPGSMSKMSQRLTNWAWVNDRTERDGQDRSWLRGKIGDLLTCQYCLGFWIVCATWAAFRWGPEWVRVGVFVWAIAGGQALLSSIDHRLTSS
jgi:hypothetical protein